MICLGDWESGEPGAGGTAARGHCPAATDRGSLQTLAGRGTVAARRPQNGPRESGSREGKDGQAGAAICGESRIGPGDETRDDGSPGAGMEAARRRCSSLTNRGSVLTLHVAALQPRKTADGPYARPGAERLKSAWWEPRNSGEIQGCPVKHS